MCALHPRETSQQFSSDLLLFLTDFLKNGDRYEPQSFRGSSALSPFTRARKQFENQMGLLRKKYSAPPAPFLKFPSDHPVDWKTPHYTNVTEPLSHSLIDRLSKIFSSFSTQSSFPLSTISSLLVTIATRLCREDEIQLGHLEFSKSDQIINFLKPVRLFTSDKKFSSLVEEVYSKFYETSENDLLTQNPFHSLSELVKKSQLEFQIFLVTNEDNSNHSDYVTELFDLSKELIVFYIKLGQNSERDLFFLF